MITIKQEGSGRLSIDGVPVVVQNYWHPDLALLCTNGSNYFIAGPDYLKAYALPPGESLQTERLPEPQFAHTR